MADRAMTRLDRIIGRLQEKFPDVDVSIDVTTLVQMACAGTAVYLTAETVVDFIQSASLLFTHEGFKVAANAIVDNPLTRWSGIGLILWAAGYGEEELSEEEKERLQARLDEIKEQQLTEEQKLALALAAAAVVPQTGQIIRGLGEIVPL